MIAIAVLFILIGVLIKYGKMYFLIAGYNTMSKDKKAEYDIEKIATLMKNVMFMMALVIIIGYFLADFLQQANIEIVSLFIAILIGIPYLLIKSNSDKYKLNSNKTD